jgi:hypothetical protein
MSSSASSSLTLELRPPWLPLAILAVWLLLLAITIMLSALPPAVRVPLACALPVAAIAPLRGQLFGLWAGAPRRISLTDDGWLLEDGRGRRWPAIPGPARGLCGCLLLRWRAPRADCWTLIAATERNREVLRRLRVRLRFS